MRKFGLVYTKLWTKKEFLSLSSNSRLLFLFLLTGPHTTSAGCFRAPKPYIAADLGWPLAEVERCLHELSTAKPDDKVQFIKYCSETEWVLIPKFLSYNPIANPNIGKNVAASLELLPDNFCFFDELAEMLLSQKERFERQFVAQIQNRLTNRFGNGSRNKYKEKYKEKEKYKDIEPQSPSPSAPDGGDPSLFSSLDPDNLPANPDDVTDGYDNDDGSDIGNDDFSKLHVSEESSDEGSALRFSSSRPPCPQKQIVDLYHQLLPELPQVRTWSNSQKRTLAARWNEDAERQSLDWWQEFFERVSRMDFLMGRVNPSRGSSPFQATLGWMVLPTNFAKILNGQYPERSSPLPAESLGSGRNLSAREERTMRACEAFIAGAPASR